jgi:transposase InsO family protein
LNAHLERFFGSLKAECLDRLILFGEHSLRNAVRQYLEHYHSARNHQGLGNRIIAPGEEVHRRQGPIQCQQRLGGLPRYYYRDAA